MSGKKRAPEPIQPTVVILTDANVLINLIHIGQLDLLKQLPGYRFVVPEHVEAEVNQEDQARRLAAALTDDVLATTAITALDEMALYAELHRTLGQGESACLAIAVHRGFSVASDEKKAFRRTAIKHIGEGRLMTTPDLIVSAIRAGLATVAQADQWKHELERRRFKMKFDSFQDLL
jgi:predicted nucleic acid-binding protein